MLFHKQAGSSLIEILIALSILAILLLGVDAVQIVALKKIQQAYESAVAVQQLSIVAERLYAATESDRAALLSAWNKQNQEVLPQGRGVISGVWPDVKISICWRGDKNATAPCLYL